MRTKILMAGFVGLSLLAPAQSQPTEKKDTSKDTSKVAADVKSPRDLSTGQTSGKLAAQGVIHRDLAARTAGAGYNVKSQTKARVAAGDVNGDGVADATAGGNSGGSTQGTATTGHSDVKSPRDPSTGMPTGKRQPPPVTLKETDSQPNK